MSKQSDRVINQLGGYGVSRDEAGVYLELLSMESNSALELSRKIEMARTKVYRVLDSLVEKGLVVVRLHERGKRYQAVEPRRLKRLIVEKEQEVMELREGWEELEENLAGIAGQVEGEGAKVLYYHGVEGLKQVTWNSLRAKGELLTMEVGNMDDFFPKKYAEEMRGRFVEREIKIRTLTNLSKIEPWTKVGEMVEKYWNIRHVPEDKLKINSEILIYNDVYVMYRYVEGEIFCVEIYSEELAGMQRQIFEMLWGGAGEMRVLSEQGEAELIMK